jgi:uncharacterized protein YggT (Ycf19 family)
LLPWSFDKPWLLPFSWYVLELVLVLIDNFNDQARILNVALEFLFSLSKPVMSIFRALLCDDTDVFLDMHDELRMAHG